MVGNTVYSEADAFPLAHIKLFSACMGTGRKCELHHMQEDFYKTLKKDEGN